MTGAAQNSSKSRWKSASVSGRSSDSGMKGSGGDGNCVPEYSLYRFHLYIIFRVCKGPLWGVFVNWCKVGGMFRMAPCFPWPESLHCTLKVQMWYKYNEKKDKKQ